MKKNTKYKYKTHKKGKSNDYVTGLISRLLLSLIIFFAALIFTTDSSNLRNFKKYFVEEHLSFSKINKLYSKYLGSPIPIKKEKTTAVFKEGTLNLKPYENGYLKKCNKSGVQVIKEGIVVKISNTKKFGKTLIIQGLDEIDYTYAYLDEVGVKLYDYVSAKTFLGTCKNKLYLAFKKNNMYIKYEELPINQS